MDHSGNPLSAITAQFTTQLEDYLVNNNGFLERLASLLPSAATATDDDIARHAPHPDAQQPTDEEQRVFQLVDSKSKKVANYSGCEKVACPTCNKTVTLRSLSAHMDMHLMYDKRPYHCEPCKAYFAYKKNYVRHMREQHP